MLAASPDACHASKKKAKTQAETLTKKSSKIIETTSSWSLFQLLALNHPKKHQNGLPEPFPGASRGLPGTSWQGQDGQKTAPTAAQERFQSGRGQPSGAQLPPKRSPEVSRTQFWPPRDSIFEPLGADFEVSAAFSADNRCPRSALLNYPSEGSNHSLGLVMARRAEVSDIEVS